MNRFGRRLGGRLGLWLSFLISCCVAVAAYSSHQKGVPDEEIGLSKASVFDTPAPPAANENSSDPGDNALLPRANPVGPALVPHMVADFLPITREENLCLECHMTEGSEEGGPVPIPESHYVDYRNAPDERRDSPAGSRYYCVSCHVALTDAPPLVGNRFSK
jgi:cytochrome c-type protein NapB